MTTKRRFKITAKAIREQVEALERWFTLDNRLRVADGRMSQSEADQWEADRPTRFTTARTSNDLNQMVGTIIQWDTGHGLEDWLLEAVAADGIIVSKPTAADQQKHSAWMP